MNTQTQSLQSATGIFSGHNILTDASPAIAVKYAAHFKPLLPVLFCFLLACIGLPALAEPFQSVSVLDPALSAPAGGSGDSVNPVISADGRYVLFASAANNLVLTGS